ncbi:TOTE conflict system archaeo-eukaryotic primase domain-containing protein [Croceibacter atlanticus]|uniref:TOTE conflict system archaeo-eukaryotic primase domain-containing protein n=1 Tax=Croceibacter atlanticus TaxID=313588 RepID=UPI0030DC79C2|tara:strand:- start:4667 stop:6205 length:1539 start_codon:yes stop_codon:yes gene_type:complete
MESLTKRFYELFKGFSKAHGQTELIDSTKHGKQMSKSYIVREPLSLDLLQQHLEGKRGIGSIPIDENNKCGFGVLDIDEYNLDLKNLAKKIKSLKLPLTLCRSKSGGAHLYIFLKEKITATEIRDRLSEFASALGYGNCEIFPKQEEVIVERGDVGNFINLPYFNYKYTMRYAINNKGDDVSLKDFITKAEKNKITIKDLRDIVIGTNKNILPSGPPCLRQLTEFGIPEGGRNNTMLNIGLYYKMASPENWKDLLEKHNNDHCTPPLPAKEIVTIQNQLEKKEYFYACKQEPLKSHCNKSLCKTMKFGVGTNLSMPTIGGLTVVESEPPVWFVDVDGHRLELSTKQLQMQVDFQRACMEQMYKMPARLKESDWREMVDALLANATRISVPEELTQKGQFQELLEMFCTARLQARSPEELMTGKPWTDEDCTYFKLSSLQDFLKRHNFNIYTRGQITERLKELNGGSEADKQYRFKDNKNKWQTVRVWSIPEIKRGEVDLPKVEVDKDEEPPF